MEIINKKQIETMSIDEMQIAHEKEIDLINEIHRLVIDYDKGNAELSVLEGKLDEYIENVKEHFDLEERLMEEYDFPSYDLHKLAHDMFVADLMYAKRQWKEFGSLSGIVNFVHKSPEWINMHVTTADAPTADYIAKKSK